MTYTRELFGKELKERVMRKENVLLIGPPKTDQVSTWDERYDQKGNVNRVHPKMIDG